MVGKMAISTKPNYFEGKIIIRVVHFSLGIAAFYAISLLNFAAPEIDSRIRPGIILFLLFWVERVGFSPYSHIGGVAFQAVSTISIV